VLLFLGLTMLINGALANGILQSVVPDELRGRVMATYVFVYVGFTPIGSFIAGAMARFVGVQWAIFTGGVIMLAYSLWAFWKYPEIQGSLSINLQRNCDLIDGVPDVCSRASRRDPRSARKEGARGPAP